MAAAVAAAAVAAVAGGSHAVASRNGSLADAEASGVRCQRLGALAAGLAPMVGKHKPRRGVRDRNIVRAATAARKGALAML